MATAMVVILAAFQAGAAEKRYSTGASDTEIKIGNTMPYSGPASAYSTMGKAEAAYFRKINEEGGINGRNINFISYDDAYSPPKAVEQARKLVESDEVLLMFSPQGTPSNTAMHKYLNIKKVPHIFVASASSKWNDPKQFPWTMGFATDYQSEGSIYASYVLKEKADSKIAVLYQNDDFGKELLRGLKSGLGEKSSMIAAEASYEVSDPTVESQIVTLRHSGADVLMIFVSPKFGAQSIRRVAEIGWKPLIILDSTASSVGSVMIPAGLQNAQNVMSATYQKDALDPQWNDDPGMKRYKEFVAKYLPDANLADSVLATGYMLSQGLVQVLKQCGDDLTRENVMRQAQNLKAATSDVLIPGIDMNTGPTDFQPLKRMQLMRFEGERWHLVGDVVSAPERK
ncbi:ABC transporter substrate-binding protein [Bradyrhizobium genosp. P]|uniref:ABC transporter substrate-binding protein n=1 Tax=Bradyrhizobium genosp. P TaxID=83641 RepID=UPI003CF24DC4